jgi:hypothetical protein
MRCSYELEGEIYPKYSLNEVQSGAQMLSVNVVHATSFLMAGLCRQAPAKHTLHPSCRMRI